MDTLYSLIFDYFHELIFHDNNGSGDFFLHDFGVKLHNVAGNEIYISMQEWLCHTASIISITIILVLCCMFIYKIIKLIGGLIR